MASNRPRRQSAIENVANAVAGSRYANTTRNYGVVISDDGNHAAFRVNVDGHNYLFNMNDQAGSIYPDGFGWSQKYAKYTSPSDIHKNDYRPLTVRQQEFECARGKGTCALVAQEYQKIFESYPGTDKQKLDYLTERAVRARNYQELKSNVLFEE